MQIGNEDSLKLGTLKTRCRLVKKEEAGSEYSLEVTGPMEATRCPGQFSACFRVGFLSC